MHVKFLGKLKIVEEKKVLRGRCDPAESGQTLV